MTTFKQVILPIALTAVIATVIGCTNGKTDTKSMDQIYAEEGVPVRLQLLKPEHFSSEAEFTTVLTGIEESSAYARIAARIDRINARVGDFVEKDSVIIELPTDNPSAQFQQVKVQYENAAATFARMQQYFQAGGLSRQQLEDAETAFRVAEANWDAARQAVLIRAPISGVITRLNVRESDNVEKDDELLTVSKTNQLKATVWVPDTDIESLRVGQLARADWNGEQLSGRVVQVDRSVNRQRQAFGVDVKFDNPDLSFRSGVTATVAIATYTNDAALVTKRKNVLSDTEGHYVFVAIGSRAEKRYVTLGHSYLLEVELTEGVKPGEQLVTEGQLHLDNGTLLKMTGDSIITTPVALLER